MNRIISKKELAGEQTRLEISTPLSSRSMGAGQYMVVRAGAGDPAVALPVVRCDAARGTVTVIVCPEAGGRLPLASLSPGSVLMQVEGPYGLPMQLPASATVLCVGDDKGVAALLAIVTALRATGNRVLALLDNAPDGKPVPEEEIGALAHELLLLTPYGSVRQPLKLGQAVARVLGNTPVQGVFVVGGARTIRDTFAVSMHHPISTQALMLGAAAGNSVHGIFRVSYGSPARPVCVDGHDFNAYYATFDEMVRRFEQTSSNRAGSPVVSAQA